MRGPGRIVRWTIAALAAALAAPTALAADKVTRADIQAVVASPGDSAAVARLLSKLPKVTLDDGGTPRTFYLWQGDLLLDADGVVATLLADRRDVPPPPGKELLVLIDAEGNDVLWPKGARTLTYAVDCKSFGTPANCTAVKAAMADAGKAWVAACPECDMRFSEVPMPADGAIKEGRAPTFLVRYQPDTSDYVALAFFPNESAYKRIVFVSPSWFSITSFDRTGILRHELGHVLGYRHEHTQDIAGCFYEDDRWRRLSPYDPRSVMHYFCGGGGTRKLALSDVDIKNHRIVYAR